MIFLYVLQIIYEIISIGVAKLFKNNSIHFLLRRLFRNDNLDFKIN
jgi:hypothetical protein